METIKDILSEMRNLARLDENSTDKIPRRLQTLALLSYADRIEKAVANCNHLKMREALEQISRIVWDKHRHTKEETEAHRLATEALSAQPRNCDVYRTSWDVVTHWDGGLDSTQSLVLMLDWLLAEAKGGNNGND